MEALTIDSNPHFCPSSATFNVLQARKDIMQWISTVYIKAMIIEGREDEMGHPFDDEDSEDDSDGEMDKQPFSIDVNYNSLLAANSDIPNAEKVRPDESNI